VAKSKPKVTSVVVYKHGGQLNGPDVEQVASRTNSSASDRVELQ